MSQLWEVVGGADTGGVVVREGKNLDSPALTRLAFGAIVREVELDGKRLNYTKVSGAGPNSGWVSLSNKEKILLVKTDKESPQKGEPDSTEEWYVVPAQAASNLPDTAGAASTSPQPKAPQDQAAPQPEAAATTSPQAVPQAAPEAATQAASETAPEAAPEVAPEAVPQASPEAPPQAASEAAPQAAPRVTPSPQPEVPQELPTEQVLPEPVDTDAEKDEPHAEEVSTSQAEAQVPTVAVGESSSTTSLQLPSEGDLSVRSQRLALTPMLCRPCSPLLYLYAPTSKKHGLKVQGEARLEDEVLHDDLGSEQLELENAGKSWFGKTIGRLWRSDIVEDVTEDVESEVDSEAESQSEDSDSENRKLPREKRKCCSPGCPYRVHTMQAYGSFCCIACFETGGCDHGPKCERIRMTEIEEEKKEEDKKAETPEDEDGSEDDKEQADADAKKKEQEEEEKAKQEEQKKEESQEEKDAKDMIEKSTSLAGKLQDLANKFLKGGSTSTSDEESKEIQVLKDIARRHGATGKLELAKKLQESASALLMDGVLEDVEKLAKKMQDAAFGLLKQAEPEPNEEEEKKEQSEVKHAKSEVKEEKAKTPEYWRKEVAKQRRTGNKDEVLRVLLEGTPELLKEKLVEEIKQLALRMQRSAVTLTEQSASQARPDGVEKAEPAAETASAAQPATETSPGAQHEDAQTAESPSETPTAITKSALVKELEEIATELAKAGVIKEGADLAKRIEDLASLLQQRDDSSQEAEGALAEAQLHSSLKDVSKRMRDVAVALLKGSVIEEARTWAKEIELEYRKIGSRWRLGIALNNIALAHLRMLEGPYTLPEDVLDSRARSTLQDRSERCREALVVADEAVGLLRHIGHPREELDLAAGRDVLSKLRDLASQDEVLKAKEDLASKGKTIKADQDKGEGTLRSWRKTVSKARTVYEQAPTGRGDHQALANTLQQAANFFLKKGASLQEAAAMAEEAASLYRKTGDPVTIAKALDTCARAHLKVLFEDHELNMSELIERQNLLKAKTAASEAVSTLGKRKMAGLEYALAASYCTLTRVHALTLDETQEEGLLQSMYETLVSKFRGSGRINLQRSFGYAAGLARPPSFARFDIRSDICLRVGGFLHGQLVKDMSGNKYVTVGVKFSDEDEKLPQLYFQPKSISKPATCCFTSLPVKAMKAVLTSTGKEESVEEVLPQDFDVGEDSDGEMVMLCHECLLPLGGAKYASPDGEGFIHGECMARILLDKSQSADKNREIEDARRKARDREEYNVGWRADRMIPRNDDFLRKAKVKKPPGAKVDSMYALVLESGSPAKVRLVPTTDPDAFINLNFLMTALQVRIKANMAPYFSLDSPNAFENWQCKVFGPPWLKGTAVGEILFQADYHLKELSMGDSLFDQPVSGMKSCWDYSWSDEGWRGREWFVVKNAKVDVSDTNVLLPHVQMGVEAREQVANQQNQLVDAPVTSTGHPLVKYADEFSHYFDLVAERKSVIYQLREVSRAAILAKFLVDNKVAIDDLWLAAKEDMGICKMDLPHNKQERYSYNIMVLDGIIKEQHGGVLSGMVGLYGGVDLNIEAFDLTMPSRIGKSIEMPDYAAIYSEAGHMGTADELTKLSQRELRKLVQEAGGEPPIGPTEKSDLIDMLIALREAQEDEADEGEDGEKPKEKEGLEYLVNLEEDLRKMSLSQETIRSVLSAIRERAGAPKTDEKVSKDKQSFSESLNDESNPHAALFRSIFRSRLADREQERTFFIPPVPKEAYLKKLQTLVDEEKDLREKRKQRFLSKDFVVSSPGEFFPSSWKPNFQMHLGRGESVGAGGNTARGKRLVESAADGKPIMESVKPTFDKKTEDFTRFRIYRRGNLEVRTIQEDQSTEESIGVVFEVIAAPPLSDNSPVVKVTEFVKRGEAAQNLRKDSPPVSPSAEGSSETAAAEPLEQMYCYFVLYETDLGDAIVTAQSPDGTILFEENPADMDERFSRARVLRVSDCSTAGASVGTLRQQCKEAIAEAAASAESLTRVSTRRYAEMAFEWPGGKSIVSDDSKPQKAPEMKPLPTKENAEKSWLSWGKANADAEKAASPAKAPPASQAQPAAGAPRTWNWFQQQAKAAQPKRFVMPKPAGRGRHIQR